MTSPMLWELLAAQLFSSLAAACTPCCYVTDWAVFESSEGAAAA
jgi:hypothetical protein